MMKQLASTQQIMNAFAEQFASIFVIMTIISVIFACSHSDVNMDVCESLPTFRISENNVLTIAKELRAIL